MGRLSLIARLISRDLHHRPAEAILLLLAITAAATTLTLGLVLHGVTSGPYERTRAATVGPDLVASLYPRPGSTDKPANPANLAPLTRARGVTASGGPYPVLMMVAHANGYNVPVEAEGREPQPGAVDRPALTAGTWLRPGAVVVERGFASALGLRAGDTITLDGRSFLISGIAVSVAVPAFPMVCSVGCDFPADFPAGLQTAQPGLVWMAKGDLLADVGPRAQPAWTMNLRLADPAGADAYASAYDDSHTGTPAPYLTSWQYIASAAGRGVEMEQQVLLVGSLLLGILAIASVAVLAGGRMAGQVRRVGMLKAAGASPELVAIVLLATVVPAIRGARTSTISALDDAARTPRRRAIITRLSRRMPPVLLLGLRISARRPRRTLLGSASVTVTVAGIVTVLMAHAKIDARAVSGGALENPLSNEVIQMTTVITVALVLLATVNALLLTYTTVLDARRSSALSRALGVTAGQASVGLAVAQMLPALAGAIAGVPLGILLYASVKHGSTMTYPPAWWLVAVVIVTPLAVGFLTILPSRAASHTTIARTLRSEAG
jgi:hypothetical protein